MPSTDGATTDRKVAERIRESRDLIIERWTQRARTALPAAREQSRIALVDSLPVFLGELTDLLADEQSRPEMLERERLLGHVHGVTRAQTQEYDLGQVTQEYNILRHVLFEFLEAESPLVHGVRDIILESIHIAVRNAVDAFVTQRRAEEQRQQDEKRTEAAQVASRERLYDAMLSATNDHVFALDPSGHMLYVNRAAAAVYGRTPSELIGLAPRDFWVDPMPLDQFEQGLAKALDGEHVVQPLEFPTPSGMRHFENALSPVLGEDSRVKAVVGITRDVHERALAEAERERFFQLSPDMFCIAGEDTYLKRVNPAFTETLGWTEEELLSRPYLDFIHPDDLASTLAKARTLSEGTRTRRFENRYRCKDGSYKWLAWSTSPVPELGVMYAAARDVTDVKAAEAEKQHRAEFEQQLIGIVSHDLRSPITAIRLNAQGLLRNEKLDERTLRSVLRIQSSVERASRMIHDLLDFTQARLGGGIPVQPSAIDLQALVRQTLVELESGHPTRDIVFRNEGDGHGEWDPDRVAQVVTNLVTNALKYSPEKTSVTVMTHGRDGTVRLSVHNEGAPIPADRVSRLFEPMQRATSQEDTTGRSVGLGLYIVQQIVEAHHGHVSVRSTAAEGTTFTVELPRQGSSTPSNG